MRTVRLAICIGLALTPLAGARLSAAPARAPQPKPALCVAQGDNARVEWTSTTASAARVYFRSANAKMESFVEMQRGTKGRFWAVLPRPADGTSSIEYRVTSRTPAGDYAVRQSGKIEVSAGCVAKPWSAQEALVAASLVVGTPFDATPVPIGFRCDGIAAFISTKGDLIPYDACHEAARASADLAQNYDDPLNPAPGASPSTSTGTATRTQRSSGVSAPPSSAFGMGIAVPYHHLRPYRSPVTSPRPPQPRLQEPVSQSRP